MSLDLSSTILDLIKSVNDVLENKLSLSGGALTGALTTKDLTLKGIEQFQTHYAKKLIGTLSAGTNYANLDSKYKDGTYHRMWRLRFPASCNFWGKIKITLYGGYSSFNASGIMSKSITCNFNGSSIYNNVGFYDGLGVNVEKDFRISEAIWNSTASAWEILIWQKNLSGNNSPTILIEAWSSSETHLTSAKNITAQAVELTQATTYTASKASSTGGTKTVTWATTPVYETPLGEEIATMSDIPSVPSVSVTQKLTSGTEIGSIKVGTTTTKLYAPTGSVSGNYLSLSGGTLTGNVLLSNSNAQGSQPNLKWKTINSKTPYVGYCTASADGTFLVASLTGTSYTTGLSIGGSSGNLLWKGTKVATTSDIPTALKNPNALKFGSKTYDGSSAQTITASDIGANVTVTQKLTSGEEIGSIKVGSTTTKLYAPTSTGSGSYQPKKRKVTLAELRTAMKTMTTGTRIQVVPHGVDDELLYSVGACITYSYTYRSAYNSQTDIEYDGEYLGYYNWQIRIDATLAQAIYRNYSTNGSTIYQDEALNENLTDNDTDFYILD